MRVWIFSRDPLFLSRRPVSAGHQVDRARARQSSLFPRWKTASLDTAPDENSLRTAILLQSWSEFLSAPARLPGGCAIFSWQIVTRAPRRTNLFDGSQTAGGVAGSWLGAESGVCANDEDETHIAAGSRRRSRRGGADDGCSCCRSVPPCRQLRRQGLRRKGLCRQALCRQALRCSSRHEAPSPSCPSPRRVPRQALCGEALIGKSVDR